MFLSLMFVGQAYLFCSFEIMAAVPKRIEKETQKLFQEPRMICSVSLCKSSVAPGLTACPDPENYRYFHVTMEGPSGTPYEGM